MTTLIILLMIQNNTEIWEIRTENPMYTLLRNNRLWYLYFLLCHSKVSSLFFSFCLFCLFSLRKDPQCRFIRQYWYIHLQNMCCGMGHHNELKSYLKKHLYFDSLIFLWDNPIHTALAWKIKLWPFEYGHIGHLGWRPTAQKTFIVIAVSIYST